jgi:hypothetical protein
MHRIDHEANAIDKYDIKNGVALTGRYSGFSENKKQFSD